MKKKIIINYSGLNCLKHCPYRYLLEFKEKRIKETKPSIYASFGTACHDSINMWYCKKGKLLKCYVKAFKKQFKKDDNYFQEGYNKEDYKKFYTKGKKYLTRFYKAQVKDGLPKPVFTEKQFKIELKYKEYTIIVYGKIDVIFVKKNKAIIWDFKTSSKMKTQSEVNEDLQLVIYALAVKCLRKEYKELRKVKKIIAGIYYLKFNKKMFMKKVKYDVFYKRLDELISIVKHKAYRPTPGSFCFHCQYKLSCKNYFKNKRIKGLKRDILNFPLRDFQLNDVSMMINTKTVLNANEMGLGKTIETIAMCKHLKEKKEVLIVCPASLADNWAKEIEKFSDLSYVMINGNPEERKKKWKKDVFIKIVSYEALLNDISKKIFGKKEAIWTYEIVQQNWDIIVLDEASKIKSYNAKISRAIKTLVGEWKIALTGTPIENDVVELYSIFQFIDSSILGMWWNFANRYLIYKEQWAIRWIGKGKKRRKRKFKFKKVIGFKNLEELRQRIAPFFIRHNKEEVLKELPKVIEKMYYVDLPKEQRDVYDDYENEVYRYCRKMIKRGKFNVINSLVKIMRLRQAANATQLVSDIKCSAKIDLLKNILDALLKTNRKVLIFSQFKKIINLIEESLNVKTMKIVGGTKDKNKVVGQFNESKDCKILLLTDAGKYGLNIQSASIIINIDLPWNPTIYAQRYSRAHRMGQKLPVTVISLTAKDTIEDKVIKVIWRKQKLFKKLIDKKLKTIYLAKNITEKDIVKLLRR